MYLIGVDVGGTFTDIVFADTESGRTLIHKTPTTRDDPSRGVVAGIGELYGLPRVATLPFAAAGLLAIVLTGSYRRVERVVIVVGLFELAFSPRCNMAAIVRP